VILPTKRIPAGRSLLGLGARILRHLRRPQTVSKLWEAVGRDGNAAVPYDWFVLALDLLFAVGAVDLDEGRVRMTAP
jgi:hypothetical protein